VTDLRGGEQRPFPVSDFHYYRGLIRHGPLQFGLKMRSNQVRKESQMDLPIRASRCCVLLCGLLLT